VTLRAKLLLVSLLTLVLPWSGCQYAREMENALRAAEEQSLAAVARTMADSLQGRADLLYRSNSNNAAPAGELDLEPITLPGAPFLDGYADEWPATSPAWKYFSQGKDRLGILAGVHDRMLYLLLDVRDNKLVFDAQDADPLDPSTFGDRLWLSFQDAEGAERQLFIAASSPGPVQARQIETR